ncbi:MAG: folate-binding protein [Anderseniella sp.]
MTVFISYLSDRRLIEIKGDQTLAFLQDLVTANVADLIPGQAAHTGLLTPQGKILFDFFVLAIEGGVLIDCQKFDVDNLVQKLSMYRLRRALTIKRVDEFAVAAVWGDVAEPEIPGGYMFQDPRNPDLGYRVIAPAKEISELGGLPVTAYASHRYTLGIADAAEIGAGQLFPHEANYDQFGSVDFKKGCYIGQEVVSRMQHRGTARSRILAIECDTILPAASTKITGGEKTAGSVLAALGNRGLAVIRLDRAAKAQNMLSVDGRGITMHKPSWATWKDPETTAEDED